MNDLHPDLTALLRGELTNAMAVAAAEHARGCQHCRQELVDDALGHGLLTSARRTLGATGFRAARAGRPARGARARARHGAPVGREPCWPGWPRSPWSPSARVPGWEPERS